MSGEPKSSITWESYLKRYGQREYDPVANAEAKAVQERIEQAKRRAKQHVQR